MATCIQSIVAAIATGIDLIPELFPNTITPISISQVSNQLLRIRVPSFQTINFQMALSPTGSVSSVNVSFSVYRVIGTTITDMGGVSITELNSTFTKDFSVSDYVICIRTNNLSGYTGTLLGSFIGYPTIAQLAPVAHEGASVSFKFDDTRPPRPCDEAMFFEIVEGSLPPGIFMDPLGKINGRLPNLDCIDPEDAFSPSMNWSFEQDGAVFPWGRQWRFRIRVSLQSYPESWDEDWFCIRVHNNWDFDRDNFMSQMPFDSIRDVQVIEPPKKLPSTLCIEKCNDEDEPFVPTKIEDICEPCLDPDFVTDVVLIPIPEQLKNIPPSQFTIWYDRNVRNMVDIDSECFEVRKFLNDLKNSPLFLKLLAQNGLGPKVDKLEEERQFLVASQFQNFLQITASSLVNGLNTTDLDYQMNQWKNTENQKLPITANGISGETLSVILQ